MFNKFVIFFIGIFFFASFNLAQAGLVINEIMYDVSGADTNHEWVEIFNSSASDIDLSGWKWNDGSNHNLNQPPQNGGQGSLVIGAGTYAILSGDATIFLLDYSSYVGTVIDTVMSLNNTGATLSLIKSDGTTTEDIVSYSSSTGANGDGNSLQLINGTWTPSIPTPGQINQSSSGINEPAIENNNNTNTSSSSGGSGGVVLNNNQTDQIIIEKSIKTKVAVKTLSFVDTPLSFKATAFGYSGEELYYGKYFWNFGDGSSMETTDSSSFTHIYHYPGDYLISMSFYLNSNSQIADSINKIKIKVVPLEISISKIGDVQDFFVELYNNSVYDMDLFGWSLSLGEKKFSFPKDTNILAKNKIKLPSIVTGFNSGENNNFTLISPQGKIVSQFDNNVIVKTPPTPSPTLENNKVVTSIISHKNTNKEENTKIPEINLTSSAINTDAFSEDSSNSYIYSIILLIFLSIGGGVVYLVRRAGISHKTVDDFEILDE